MRTRVTKRNTNNNLTMKHTCTHTHKTEKNCTSTPGNMEIVQLFPHSTSVYSDSRASVSVGGLSMWVSVVLLKIPDNRWQQTDSQSTRQLKQNVICSYSKGSWCSPNVWPLTWDRSGRTSVLSCMLIRFRVLSHKNKKGIRISHSTDRKCLYVSNYVITHASGPFHIFQVKK